MSEEELKKILADHAKWLSGEGGKQADLSGADLRGANMSGSNLSEADIRVSDISGANLSMANLSMANLSEANLSMANLSMANLSGVDLSMANLRRADLSGANLSEANLSGARVDAAVCRMDFGGWSICVYADRTSIGCQTHPNECWLAWEPDSAKIVRMHKEAYAWWATHGEAVKAAIRCVMAKAAKGGYE